MNNRKIKLLALIAIASLLVGCNNVNKDKYILVGFNKFYGSSNPTSQVGLAFRVEREQSLYFGARKGFTEDWKNDLWECNPGYGTFAINRIIEDEAGKEIQSDFIILEDFPNDEKYPLTYETIEGTVDGVIMHYEGYMTNTFNFTSIETLKGSIGYYICYYDDVNQKPFEGDYYLYGISWGGKLNFEKNDNFVIFDKKNI